MASLLAPKPALIFSLLFIAAINVSCFEYEVGGEKGKGWIKPDGNEFETYNEWVEHHRFHIGDSIYFKYNNDSVLQVEGEYYDNCTMNNPVSKFNDGNTVFKFDNPGFFFFISGNPGHCEAGQKMIIRVMVQSSVHHPTISSPAPSPEGPSGGTDDGSGGWKTGSWGPSPVNSTDMLSVTSCFLILFMGVVIVLYVFMD